MESYSFTDSIQVEKANALARYKRFNNISKMLRFIEVFIAVTLISWSSTRLPTVLKVSGEYLYACSSYVLNQHVVFLVGNVIVVLCYVLSDVGNDIEPEILEDVSYRISTDVDKTSEAVSNTEPVEQLPTVMEDVCDHKVVQYESANVKVKIESDVAPEKAIKQATKQIERFQRTQSVKLRREISRSELRRSVSERRRSAVNGDRTPPSLIETVESLSNEEFRLAVEAFISKQQRLRKQQTMVDQSNYYYC